MLAALPDVSEDDDEDDEDDCSTHSRESTSSAPTTSSAPRISQEFQPTQKVAVLVLLGPLHHWPYELDSELRERLKRKLRSRLELCGVPKLIVARGELELQRGHTLAALFTLGCPTPAVVLSQGHASGRDADELLRLDVHVPSAGFWACRPLRNVSTFVPKHLLRWTNFWHPADPLAFPVCGLMGGHNGVDVQVRLHGGAAEVDPLDYLGKHASKEVFAPVAYTITQLWLHANPQVEADTTQLEQLAQHGSGTRAKLFRKKNTAAEASRAGAHKAAQLAKQRAKTVLEAAVAAREKAREAREARAAATAAGRASKAAPRQPSASVSASVSAAKATPRQPSDSVILTVPGAAAIGPPPSPSLVAAERSHSSSSGGGRERAATLLRTVQSSAKAFVQSSRQSGAVQLKKARESGAVQLKKAREAAKRAAGAASSNLTRVRGQST